MFECVTVYVYTTLNAQQKPHNGAQGDEPADERWFVCVCCWEGTILINISHHIRARVQRTRKNTCLMCKCA